MQMFYLTLMNALSYLAPSFFLFTVHIAMEAFRADVLTKILGGVVPDQNNNELYNGFVYTMDFIYVILIFSIVFFSLHLTNSNTKFKPYLYAVSTLFGIFSIIVFTVLLVDVVRGLVDGAACTFFLT
jgi:hypothetical protein